MNTDDKAAKVELYKQAAAAYTTATNKSNGNDYYHYKLGAALSQQAIYTNDKAAKVELNKQAAAAYTKAGEPDDVLDTYKKRFEALELSAGNEWAKNLKTQYDGIIANKDLDTNTKVQKLQALENQLNAYEIASALRATKDDNIDNKILSQITKDNVQEIINAYYNLYGYNLRGRDNKDLLYKLRDCMVAKAKEKGIDTNRNLSHALYETHANNNTTVIKDLQAYLDDLAERLLNPNYKMTTTSNSASDSDSYYDYDSSDSGDCSWDDPREFDGHICE